MSWGAMDPDRLPRRALMDTGACIFALRAPRKNPRSRDHKEFLDAMIENGRDVLIAAPSIAELRRKYETPLPRVRNILVVPFDEEAADRLAREFPARIFHEIRKADGTPLNYIKYDSLIVACALRHRADCLITTDETQRKLADEVGLRTASPMDFRDPQSELNLPAPGIIELGPKG